MPKIQLTKETFEDTCWHGLWPSTLSSDFSDCFLVVDETLAVEAANEKAAPLVASLGDESSDLWYAAHCALNARQIDQIKLRLMNADGEQYYELFFIPHPAASKMLILARETTLEHNLIVALMESRQLFKDLVSCSSDFAWETNATGDFIYVSPKGALGYTALELVGRPSGDLLCATPAKDSAFQTETPVDSADLWLYCSDGSKACVTISAVPRFGPNGIREGARGVCRDITQIKNQQALLEQARSREKLMTDIVGAMRDLKAGDHVLERTAQAISKSMANITCLIARRKGRELAFVPGAPNCEDEIKAALLTRFQQMSPAIDQSGAPQTRIVEIQGFQALMIETQYRHTTNGAIFLLREISNDPLPEGVREILVEVGGQVGIAIEQITTHERLENLSRTDELTGLLNRRAFFADAEAQLLHLRSDSGANSAVLLYLDIDNLKSVNDQLGHASGDYVIASFARELKAIRHNGDIAARIGGDEFLIWLDGASADDAVKAANALIKFAKSLGDDIGDVSPPVGLSVGISVIRPENLRDISEIIIEADTALYRAKESGKGSFVVIDPLK